MVPFIITATFKIDKEYYSTALAFNIRAFTSKKIVASISAASTASFIFGRP